jgi:hypothetical protein
MQSLSWGLPELKEQRKHRSKSTSRERKQEEGCTPSVEKEAFFLSSWLSVVE